MKTIKFLSTLAAITLVAVFFVSCTEDEPAAPVVNYGISGTITYPDFNGTATPAGGAVVYLKMDATEATTNYDLVTVADASGNYSFVELTDGTHSVYANYNTENTNIVGRIAGAVFVSEGALVELAGATATQDFTLTSIGQADAIAVNTYEGGDFSQDWNHSNVDFSFPYDESNATYTGRFRAEEIYVDFDPFSLGTSKIEATIDVLTVITNSPGGRDPLYGSDGNLATDVDGLFNLGCIHGYLGMENDNPASDNRYSTFVSTTIETYGDGYLATGNFTINGVTAPVSMYFKYIPGFVGEDRSGNPVQFSSFQGTFDFAAYQVFGIDSGHIKQENDVTIDISFQVTKAL